MSTILTQLHEQVKNGQSLQEAIELVIPGADPTFWEARLKSYDPAQVKPRRKNRRHPSGYRSKKSQYLKQQEAIHSAILETVSRANRDQALPSWVDNRQSLDDLLG